MAITMPREEGQMSFLNRTKGFLNQIKGFVTSPVETFNSVNDEEVGTAVKYFGKIIVIFTILFTAVFAFLSKTTVDTVNAFPVFARIKGFLPIGIDGLAVFDITGAITIVIGVLLGGLILLIIGGAWTNIWVYALGARNGVGETIKAMAYGSTPMLLFGWITLFLAWFGWTVALGGLAFFVAWSAAIGIIGARQLHELETGRAAIGYLLGTVVIPVVVVAIVALII